MINLLKNEIGIDTLKIFITKYKHMLYIIKKQIFQSLILIKNGSDFRLALLCDIEADFPKSTIFPHPFGIVIRKNTAIGENCVIHQNVTIGQRRTEQEAAIIGNNVDIGANAIILGPISIGNNSKIGGRVLFLRMCLKTLLTSLFSSVDIYKNNSLILQLTISKQ